MSERETMLSATNLRFGRLSGALALAILLAVLPVTPAEASTARDAEDEFLCSVNAERTERGLVPLRSNSDLTRVARGHSANMAAASSLYHNPDLGTQVTGWHRLAENVGRGPSAASLHDALMSSSGHRANILNTWMTEIGVGVEIRSGELWVTQVFRQPSGSTSGYLPNCTQATASTQVVVSGDWNGDGRATPGRFRDGRWELEDSLVGRTAVAFTFGRAGDLPVVGDWNGDGRTTVGVVRGSEWFLRNSNSGGSGEVSFHYGRGAIDFPMAGDWNGNGRDTPGIVRDGDWHLRNSLSGGNGEITFTYGRITQGDIPIVGDWDANGRDTPGIIRDREWHLRYSLSGGPGETVFIYGQLTKGDLPVVGDWNRSGGDGIGIVRDRDWHLRNSLSGGPAHLSFTYGW